MGGAPATVPSLAVPLGPFPIGAPGSGATAALQVPAPNTPQQLRAVRVDNASPYTLNCTTGQPLGLVGAFDSHLFVLPDGAAKYLAIQSIGAPSVPVAGTDATVYVTWYDSVPVGSWPAALGAGSVTASATQLLLDTGHITVVGAGLTPFTVTVQPWHLGLFISWVPGFGTGVLVNVRGAVPASPTLLYQPTTLLLPGSPSVWVPIAGAAVTQVTINLASPDGVPNTPGELFVVALSAPLITNVVEAQPPDQQGAGTLCTSNATTTILALPQSGTIYKLKALSARSGTAGTGPNIVTVQGSPNGSGPIWTASTPAGTQANLGSIGLDMWWSDGLAAVVALNSANIQVDVAYETWPVSQVPG